MPPRPARSRMNGTSNCAERQVARHELEAASAEAETELALAEAALGDAEQEVSEARASLDRSSEESHALQVRLTEASGARRSVVERVEAEWHRPFDQLIDAAPVLDLDIETLEAESGRITAALEAIGPVNRAGGRGARRRGQAPGVPDLATRRSGRGPAVPDPGYPRDRWHRPRHVSRDLHRRPGELRQGLPDAVRRRRMRAASRQSRTIHSRVRSISTPPRAASAPSVSISSPRGNARWLRCRSCSAFTSPSPARSASWTR